MSRRQDHPTLTRRLQLWAFLALMVMWMAFVALAHRAGIIESEELTDGHLASMAVVLLNQKSMELVDPGQRADRVEVPHRVFHDYQQTLSVMAWDAEGRLISHHGDAPVPIFQEQTGFEVLQIGEPPSQWRVFSQWNESRSRKVMVMLKMDERADLASDIAGQMTVPGFWLLPGVALLLSLAIWRGLRPLYELSAEVSRLDVGRSGHLPERYNMREFLYVVRSINALIDNHNAAIERERQLANEVAHELRTPLSSLSLQLKALSGAMEPQERQETLAQMEADTLRAGRVLSQLLSLARASRAEFLRTAEPMALAERVRQLAADYVNTPIVARHNLSVEVPEEVMVLAHPLLVEVAVRNLIDNALQHTGPGTLVEVQVLRRGAEAWVQVCDNGARRHEPPVATARKPHATERLGLGHKIVQRIMDVHGGRFERVDPPPHFTTCFRLVFPLGTVNGWTPPRAVTSEA